MASLSDFISSFLSSKLPSFTPLRQSTPPTPPSISQPVTRSSPPKLPSLFITARQSKQLTTKFFTADDHDDVINRVAYPSVANANLMFFKSSYYNVEVMAEDDEPEDQLLNRFKRSVFRAGVLQESRRRRFFENSQEKRKRKAKEAAKKNRKRRPNPKPKPNSTLEIPKNKNVNKEVEEDNWEILPEEIEIPYTNRFNRDELDLP